jgi:glutaredoxin
MKIKLFTRENCGNCKKVKETLTTLNIAYEEISADDNKELVSQYAPQGNWVLPLALHFDGDDLVNVTTGIIDEETIMLPYKDLETLQAMAYRAAKELHKLEQLFKIKQSTAQTLEKIISLKEVI